MFRVHKDAGFYHTKALLGRRKWSGSCHEPFWPTAGNEPKARRLISSQRDFSTSRRDRDRFDYGVSRTWAPPISIVVVSLPLRIFKQHNLLWKYSSVLPWSVFGLSYVHLFGEPDWLIYWFTCVRWAKCTNTMFFSRTKNVMISY